MTIRLFLKKTHLWLSIPTGLIIFIICITGAILVFDTEILETYYPEHFFVKEPHGERLPLDQLIPLVSEQLSDNSISSIKITADPNRTYTGSLSEGFRSSVFVNPYTGEIKGTFNYRESFFFEIMTLHRWLMDGTRTWGKYTVGITTILFVIILISGVVWCVPSDKKKIKNRLKIKTKSGIKRFLFDLHTALGIYACLFLLICALTGLMWSFEWYRNGVYKLLGSEVPEGRGGHGRPKKKEKLPINALAWQTAYENLTKKNPNHEYISISDGSATVLMPNAPHQRATDKYSFDTSNGDIIKASLYSEQEASTKVMAWAYALHVGAYGGIVTRILTCLACIIGASLPLTGYYIFYRKHLKSKKKKRPTPNLLS